MGAVFIQQFFYKKKCHLSSGVIKHVDEVLKLLSAVSGNPNFELIIPDGKEGGLSTMDAMIAIFEQRAEARGRAEGEKFGEARGRLDIATNLKRSTDMSDEAIAEVTSLTLEQVKAISV